VSEPLKAMGKAWVIVMTGSTLALVLALAGIFGYTVSHHWVSWMIVIVSLFWAFIITWNREHRKVFILTREFAIPELTRVRHQASASTLVTFTSSDAELNFYFEKLGAAGRGISREFLAELISAKKEIKPIIDGKESGPPHVWRV
jgi:hypothetical protein